MFYNDGIWGATMQMGAKPKSCFAQVFHFKLGCFNVMLILKCVDARPYLLLKTWPMFCLDS